MNLLITLAAFAAALGSLIIFHELGHYVIARACGVKVLRFSVGFGKTLAARRFGRDRTEWVLAAFPLGGYVKMLDEREGPVVPEELHRAFNRQAVWRRFAIVIAGPAANFLLAILLYWALFLHGVQGVKPVLGPVPAETAAAHAGLKQGETITAVAGEPVATWQDVRWKVLKLMGEAPVVTLEVKNEREHIAFRKLSLSAIGAPDDLEGDLLGKLGLSRYRPPIAPIVGQVVPDSPAGRNGVRVKDRVLAIEGDAIVEWDHVVEWVRRHPGEPLEFSIEREGKHLTLRLVPEVAEEQGRKIGRLGIVPEIDPRAMEKLVTEVRYPPGEALMRAIAKTWDMSIFTLRMLGKMIVGEVSWKNLSGPITIADYAGQTAQIGWSAYLSFLALISISLGVLNLLPIPVLDGGHLMYYTIEILKGSPVSERAMEVGQRIGILLLFTLMVFALYNDLTRVLSG
jgi:regulator of sigma E protease